MITFDSVTKAYAGGTVALRELSLEVGEGEVTVLVGPSGCGKTTTLRLVNRMVAPTSGRVLVGGSDVRRTPVHELRRGIGYVIQHTGLFPHRTVAGNIATVCELLGWDKPRTVARVTELMALVGLDASLASRYPHQLSGGQRQRVGVARALAVDPPLLLMDEPFASVDPIVRGQLQEEFLRLQRELRKTILFVTHDIDEALAMGDRVAVFGADGVVEQYAPPQRLLAAPASGFVASFLGGERGLKRLGLVRVADLDADPGATVAATAGADAACQVAARAGTDWVVVLDGERPVGLASPATLNGGALTPERLERPAVVRDTDSGRAALEAILSSASGVAVRIDEAGGYCGVITRASLSEELR